MAEEHLYDGPGRIHLGIKPPMLNVWTKGHVVSRKRPSVNWTGLMGRAGFAKPPRHPAVASHLVSGRAVWLVLTYTLYRYEMSESGCSLKAWAVPGEDDT